MNAIFRNKKVRNAILLGSLCSVSYLAVYIARNLLSAVSPQMIEEGFSTEFLGKISSLYFILYAVGQLINGVIGDKMKARYMISFGLIFAGICNELFLHIIDTPIAALLVYGVSGFFLSMIYPPLAKVIAENTEPLYAVRCSLGYTFSSLLGSPIAGILAALLVWRSAFTAGSSSLVVMGMACFVIFYFLERKGIVKYNQYTRKKEKRVEILKDIKVLVQHSIVKFSIVAIVTGVVRTTVVFWMPTYLVQRLGFSAEMSAAIFTGATFIISLSSFMAIVLYEKLGKRMNLALQASFILAAIGFLLVFMVRAPFMNIIFLVIAILSSNIAASIMFSIYLPSLRDTGLVSSAAGFVDFLSYMAASIASTIFANAISSIGWGKLILVWCGLMLVGVVAALPAKQIWKGFRRGDK